MKSKLAFLFPLFVLFILIQACSKNDDNNNTTNNVHQVSATLNAAQENPAGTSTGTGTFTGSFDASTKVLTYNVTWSGLSGAATAGHIHGPAATNANAAVLIPFTLVAGSTTGSGSASGTATLPDTTIAFLQQGKLYANIHTAAKPGGEIRGQLTYQ